MCEKKGRSREERPAMEPTKFQDEFNTNPRPGSTLNLLESELARVIRLWRAERDRRRELESESLIKLALVRLLGVLPFEWQPVAAQIVRAIWPGFKGA